MLVLYKEIHKVNKEPEKKTGAGGRHQLALLFGHQLRTEIRLLYHFVLNDDNKRYEPRNVISLSIAMSDESADTIAFNNIAIVLSDSGIRHLLLMHWPFHWIVPTNSSISTSSMEILNSKAPETQAAGLNPNCKPTGKHLQK
ncbi:unnamed protein product [Cercopithifilaria johnstoni]|uniref:Uncharacterized protein n=1 Tax=Cercopithifilaria johnstoni TaxID=2874296 RepID=A0A8J2PSR0_9BILA|nr:unnamed protein product [Cercopithifilaria johnstoni]